MSLKYFERLYFLILLPFFLVFLFIFIVLLWHFLSFKHYLHFCILVKTPGKQDKILSDHIGRKEIDGIRLSSQLHKWTKLNNRLVMLWVVWRRKKTPTFQMKLWLLNWWFTTGMVFSALKDILISILHQEDWERRSVVIKKPNNSS